MFSVDPYAHARELRAQQRAVREDERRKCLLGAHDRLGEAVAERDQALRAFLRLHPRDLHYGQYKEYLARLNNRVERLGGRRRRC